MKIVINKCFGGFGLSPEALYWLFERGVGTDGFMTPACVYYGENIASRESDLLKWRDYKKWGGRHFDLVIFTPCELFVLCGRDIPRDDPRLVECVETLQEKANGAHGKLAVVEIPDNVKWRIEEYDGMETIHEDHRSWG